MEETTPLTRLAGNIREAIGGSPGGLSLRGIVSTIQHRQGSAVDPREVLDILTAPTQSYERDANSGNWDFKRRVERRRAEAKARAEEEEHGRDQRIAAFLHSVQTVADPSARGSRHRASGIQPVWRGFPVPGACRVDQRTLMELIDESILLDEAESVSTLKSRLCAMHAGGDLPGLLEDQSTFIRNGRSIRLTVPGQLALDRLVRNSSRFEESASLRLPPMYAWQHEALDSWASHGRQGVVEAVTGTGKTRVGIEAIAEALRQDLGAVVCVPTKVLQAQWADALQRAGITNVRLLGGGSRDTFAPGTVLVSTIQSLSKYAHKLTGDEGLLVADECHRYGAPTFQTALSPVFSRRLGITATFERSDAALPDLVAFFGAEPLFRIHYDRALRDDIVAHYTVLTLGVEFTDEEVSDYNHAEARCRESRGRLQMLGVPMEPFGEFMSATSALAQSEGLGSADAKGYLKAFYDRQDVLATAQGKIEALSRLAPFIGESSGTIIFSRFIKSAEAAASVLRNNGVAAVCITGKSKPDERQAALEGLACGDIKAVSAPQILDEGVDVPAADVGVVLQSTQSRRQMIQRMGRVLRKKPDGRQARFVLIYVRGTSEDPHQGAHEDFLQMVTEYADAVHDVALADGSRLEGVIHSLTAGGGTGLNV